MVTVLDVQPAINAASHRLVISTAACHLYEKSFVCPAQQELQRTLQEHAKLKSVKVKNSFQLHNVDTTTGLTVTADVRKQMRLVEEAKLVRVQEKNTKAIATKQRAIITATQYSAHLALTKAAFTGAADYSFKSITIKLLSGACRALGGKVASKSTKFTVCSDECLPCCLHLRILYPAHLLPVTPVAMNQAPVTKMNLLPILSRKVVTQFPLANELDNNNIATIVVLYELNCRKNIVPVRLMLVAGLASIHNLVT